MPADPDADSSKATDPAAGKAPAPRLPSTDAYRLLALTPEELLRQCRQARFQGSGPGGQKRNRVYSGVRVTHGATGLTAESVDSRASLRNLGAAVGRLRMVLALSASLLDCDPDQGAAGSPQAPFRAGASASHEDYPRFLLRALHHLAWHRGQLAPAAAALGCSASALTRFFKADKAAWARAKDIRETNGLHALK